MFDIERVRTSWQREAEAIDRIVTTINDAIATEPIRSDGWTSQDLLGHIANAARGFLAYIRGTTAAAIDIDAFNEQRLQQGRQRAWSDTLAYWERVKGEVADFLQSADNAIGDQPVTMAHLPHVHTASDALRTLIVHTRSHREDLEQGFPDVQA